MFQTFNEHGVRFGRITRNLQTAIARVRPCNGEVRELGSLAVVYTCKTMAPQSLQAQRIWWHSTTRVQPAAPVQQAPMGFPLYIPGPLAYPGTRIKVSRA